MNKSVAVINGAMLIDGKETRLISGAIHYFRVHPGLWEDRLNKAAACGLNCIETYIPWNFCEPERGKFVLEGMADFGAFLDKVQAFGMYAIVRPGPYICSEWENGGLPAYLYSIPGMEIRRYNEPYLKEVKRYFDAIMPDLVSRQYTKGGPILMMQVENEYGSFGHDKRYLRYLQDLMLKAGVDVPLFTSDGSADHMLVGGTLPDCWQTVNFGSRPEEAFAASRKFRPEGPDMCMEFWNGWFDHWGEKHHVRVAGHDAGGAAKDVETMLRSGAGLNFYMFHGGTNFGFTNGANWNPGAEYAPTITSYDYDCLLSEAGDPTEKYYACREVIREYIDDPSRIREVSASRKFAPAPVKLTGSVAVREALSVLTKMSGEAVTPPTMDALGQDFGFIHYRKRLDGPLGETPLRLFAVHDYAQVWLNGEYLGSRFRDSNGANPFTITVPAGGAELDVLVENCGRTNYGPNMGRDSKGITGGVLLELQMQFDWQYRTLPMSDIAGLQFGEFANTAATFHCGTFSLEDVADTFIKRPGVKGVIWINGFNLGRYWEIGPAQTLYVPAPVLKKGENSIVVLELEKLNNDQVEFSEMPDLGPETSDAC